MVTLAVESEATLRLDFARGTDAPRSITVASDGADYQRSQLFRSVCRFVWAYCPDGRGTAQIPPSATLKRVYVVGEARELQPVRVWR